MVKINVIVATLVLGFSGAVPCIANHPCSSPLILDLDGDGRIVTTGLQFSVFFDINADGELDEIGWTSEHYEEAFLWLDRNGNDAVDDGSELFGNATPLPDGSLAENGFEALAAYDTRVLGGNGDGVISRKDRVWRRLRLWIDRNHDAFAQGNEVVALRDRDDIRAIGLDYKKVNRESGNLNVHFLTGGFVKRVEVLGERFERVELIEDILFIFRDDEP